MLLLTHSPELSMDFAAVLGVGDSPQVPGLFGKGWCWPKAKGAGMSRYPATTLNGSAEQSRTYLACKEKLLDCFAVHLMKPVCRWIERVLLWADSVTRIQDLDRWGLLCYSNCSSWSWGETKDQTGHRGVSPLDVFLC